MTTHDDTPLDRIPMDVLLAHHDWVRTLARALTSSAHDADDVAQDAWMRAIRQPPRPQGSLTAWWRRVVRSAAADRRRSESRREARELHTPPTADPDRPIDIAARTEIHRRVVEAVYGLEEPHRGTLVLRYFDGMTVAEIAQRDGVTPEAIRKRTQRALELLRARLDATHDDDRERWMALLLPLTVGPGPVDVAAPPSSPHLPRLVAGLAAVAVLVVAVVATNALDGESDEAVVVEMQDNGAFGTPATRRHTATVQPPSGNRADPTTGRDDAADLVSGRATVSGRVVTGDGDEPLAGATVTIGRASTRTDADGLYHVSDVASGVGATLRASAPGLAEAVLALPRLTAGVENSLLDIRLAAPAALDVRVVDATGAPVEDARVRAYARAWSRTGERMSGYESITVDDLDPAAEAHSDADGRATLTGLAPGGVQVVADAPGYALSEPLDAIAGGDPTRDLALVLDEAVVVRGRVVDGTDGSPEAFAVVEAFTQGRRLVHRVVVLDSARTGTDGTFALAGVPRAVVYLTARPAAGMATSPVAVDARTCPVAEIVIDRRATLTGVVVDESTGASVPDAALTVTVISRGTVATVLADGDGRFSMAGVPLHDTVHVSAVAAGPSGGRWSTRAPIGTALASSGTSDLRVPVSLQGSVEGFIRAADGTAVAGARVEVLGEQRAPGSVMLGAVLATTISGPDGAYRVDGLDSGAVEILAQARAWVSAGLLTGEERAALYTEARDDDPRVIVVAGGTTRHDVEMKPACTIAGRVTDDEGAPIAGAYVVTGNRRIGSRFAATDTTAADGAFRLAGVPLGDPSDVDVVARRGAARARATVSIGRMREVEGIRLELPGTAPPPARIEGRVTAEGGLPSGTVVRFVEHGAGSRGRRDPGRAILASEGRRVGLLGDGRFVVEDLQPQSNQRPTIVVLAPGFLPAFVDTELRSGETAGLDIALELGPRITGRLLDADGAAAAGVPVRACAGPAGTRSIDGLPPAELTGPDGSFVLRPVPQGHVCLVFGYGNRPLHVHTGVYDGDEDVIARLPRDVDPDRAVLPPEPTPMPLPQTMRALDSGSGARLRGRVVDSAGHAVAQADVSVERSVPGSHSRMGTATDRDGRFEVRVAGGGVVDVRVDGGERGSWFRAGVATGRDTEIDVKLAAPGPEVRGHVVATDGDTPVGVTIHAVREDRFVGRHSERPPTWRTERSMRTSDRVEVRAAADGTFTLGRLPHGRWLIWAGGPGDAATPVGLVTRAHDDATRVELEVVRGWTLRLRTLDADGAPMVGERLALRVDEGLPQPLREVRLDVISGRDGLVDVPGLPMGAVSVRRDGRNRTEQTIEPRVDDDFPVDMR